jgi:hypothetical protein
VTESPGATAAAADPSRSSAKPLLALFHVVNVFRTHPEAYSPMAMLAAFTIAGAMNRNDECFLRIATVARWMHVSRRSVFRLLTELAHGPAPLLAIRYRGGRCSVFKLIRAPEAFARARDARVAPARMPAEAKARCVRARAQARTARGVCDILRLGPRPIPKAKPITPFPRFRPDRVIETPCECLCGALVIRGEDGENHDFDQRRYCAGERHVCTFRSSR